MKNRKIFFTCAIAFFFGLVIAGQLLESFHVDYTAQVLTYHTNGTQFQYNLWEGVSEFWKHDVKFLAIIVALFSGVWPCVKLAMMVAVLWLPLTSKKQNNILGWMGSVGKWSFFDVWVVLIVIVTFTINHVEALGKINIYGVAGQGIYVFGLALILSQVCCSLMMTTERNRNRSTLLNTKTRKVVFGGVAVPVCLLLVVGCFVPVFSTTFDMNGNETVTHYSIGGAILSVWTANAGHRVMCLFGLWMIIFVPLVKALMLFFYSVHEMGLCTMTQPWSNVTVIKWIQKWCCLDVFCAALILNMAELGNIMNKKGFGPNGFVQLSVNMAALPFAYIFFVVVFVEAVLCVILTMEVPNCDKDKVPSDAESSEMDEDANLIRGM